LDRASAEIAARPEAAVVCGRRRERDPDGSVYNLVADVEWDTPIGEARACGGDALIRTSAFARVGGYDPGVIAAEDDELCLRLRRAGWTIVRIDADMTIHDIAMTRFGQWWRRSTRTGFAFADGAARYGRAPERHFVRELRGVVCWGMLLPLVSVLAAWSTRGLSLLLAAAVCLAQTVRVRRNSVARGMEPRRASLYAMFCVLGKFPQAVGVMRYLAGRLLSRPGRIIEYKAAADAPALATDA
jgi:hypothetical protein